MDDWLTRLRILKQRALGAKNGVSIRQLDALERLIRKALINAESRASSVSTTPQQPAPETSKRPSKSDA